MDTNFKLNRYLLFSKTVALSDTDHKTTYDRLRGASITTVGADEFLAPAELSRVSDATEWPFPGSRRTKKLTRQETTWNFAKEPSQSIVSNAIMLG